MYTDCTTVLRGSFRDLALGFQKPTDIQSEVLPYGLKGRDIVGVAETVSFISTLPSLSLSAGLRQNPRVLPSHSLTPLEHTASFDSKATPLSTDPMSDS